MVSIRTAVRPALALALLAGVSACGTPPPAAPTAVQVEKVSSDESQVALRVVKWPELEKAIASHTGKVVVVDIWAEW